MLHDGSRKQLFYLRNWNSQKNLNSLKKHNQKLPGLFKVNRIWTLFVLYEVCMFSLHHLLLEIVYHKLLLLSLPGWVIGWSRSHVREFWWWVGGLKFCGWGKFSGWGIRHTELWVSLDILEKLLEFGLLRLLYAYI